MPIPRVFNEAMTALKRGEFRIRREALPRLGDLQHSARCLPGW